MLLNAIHLFRGDDDEAITLAREGAELSAQHGFAFWRAFAESVRGCALARHGGEQDGAEALAHPRAALLRTGARVFSTHSLAFLADARWREGSIGAALAAVEDGLQIAESTFDRSYWPELWRLKGESAWPR